MLALFSDEGPGLFACIDLLPCRESDISIGLFCIKLLHAVKQMIVCSPFHCSSVQLLDPPASIVGTALALHAEISSYWRLNKQCLPVLLSTLCLINNSLQVAVKVMTSQEAEPSAELRFKRELATSFKLRKAALRFAEFWDLATKTSSYA